MKNLGEKENKKKNKLNVLRHRIDNISITEKTADKMMKGLSVAMLYVVIIIITIFIFVGINVISDMIQ